MGAAVHIGPIGGGEPIVADFYRHCQRETVGPGQIETDATARTYSTLEGLLDGILASGASTHVIVNHGSPDQGLLIRFTSTSPHNATGPIVSALAALTDALAQGTLSPFDPRVVDAAARMAVDPLTAMNLISRFAQVRARRPVVHFRGCNLGRDTTMLRGYKAVLGAPMVTAPAARMFYLRIRPRRPPAGTSIPQLAGRPPSAPGTRRRMFPAPADGSVGPLLVDIRDIDGHARVESPLSVLDSPAAAPAWGALLTGRWTGPADGSFVLPALWSNTESTFHCPLEVGFRERLSFV